MPGQTVLVLATDPIIGALLGIYLELFAYRPVFADTEQASDDAVAQSDPAIILADLSHPDGGSESFVTRHRKDGRSIIAFSPRSPWGDVSERAQRLGVLSLRMPVEAAEFRAVLEMAAQDTSGRERES